LIDPKYPFDILFIEDEKAIRDNYVAYLKMFFNAVYEAEDGEKAYEIYKEKKPHILIVDIHLPKLSGIDLLKRIRKTDHTTKAIMLTAYTDTSLLLESASLKLTKYLTKPISRRVLKDALDLAIKELENFNTLSLRTINLKDNYIWNYDSQELLCDNSTINLTNKERIIFILLMSNLNKVLEYDNIIYKIWTYEDDGSLDALKTIIKNLRRKLPKDTIQNVFGVGYTIKI